MQIINYLQLEQDIGDTARQNEINNIRQGVGIATNIGGSIITGAVGGSMFGPIGAAVGAVTGLLSSVIGQVSEIAQNIEQWNLNQNKNNMEEIRNSERLGLLKTDRNRDR